MFLLIFLLSSEYVGNVVVHGPPPTGSLERDTWQRSWQTAGRWRGGEKRAKTKQRTMRVSCIFQKIGKALPGHRTTPVTPSCPAVSGTVRGTLPTTQGWQNFFFLEGDPSPPPPVPQTVCGYSSSLASFPNCPWCHRGAGSTVPALHTIPTAQSRHSWDLHGGCWGSAQLLLLCTRQGTGENTRPCHSKAAATSLLG